MLAVPLLALALFAAPGAGDVAAVVHPQVMVQAVPAAVNPHATTRATTVAITTTADVEGTLTVAVIDAVGAIVATPAPSQAVAAAATVEAIWVPGDVPDGAYGVRARLLGADGVVRESVTPVRVDSAGPQVVLAPPAPSTTARGPVALRVRTSDALPIAEVSVRVRSQDGTTIGTIAMPADADGVDWNLRLRGRPLLPGVYRLDASAVDEVGNAGTPSAARLLRVARPVRTTQISSVRDAGDVVALTYDDCGDGAAWDRILRAFRTLGAKTTFFCNGVNVRSHPVQARRTVADGHTVGSHTWAHPWMTKIAPEERARQLAGDQEIWWTVAKASPSPFFRPPYGDVDAGVRASAGAAGFSWTVLWDVDPSDYLSPPPAALVEHVRTHARAGSIVVLHVRAGTAEATPGLIKALRAKGLEPVSLDQMFGRAAYLSRAHG